MNHLRELRIENGYKSQKDLAEILFVNQTAVSQWERGATMPSTQMLLKLSDMYKVSIDYILGRTEYKNLPPTKIDEEQVNEILIQRLMSLTPEEQSKVDAFVQGLIASRANGAFPPE